MKNISYKSASAGSGKTYSLTEQLAKLIIDGKATPEQVIITTFTKVAANDIKEKAKQKIYEKAQQGFPELESMAQRLDQAMINTIDGICNAFINRYWYYLGLNPDLTVLSEEDKSFLINQSLSNIAEPGELKFFNDFRRLFGVEEIDYWKDHLVRIVEFMNSFNIDDLEESEACSIALAESFHKKGYHKNLPTVDEINAVFEQLENPVSTNQKLSADLEKLRTEKKDTYSFILRLLNVCKTNGKTKAATESFREEYGNIFASDEVFDCNHQYIAMLFNLAKRWREEYSLYKDQHHAVDFSDMERYMFKLLNEDKYEEVRQEIKSMYKYAFVDEYQDCSPLQVQMFDKLSELMVGSFWVGDAKQAIYGFRGSDSVLTEAVVKTIEQQPGCKLDEPLDISRRSVPALVEAVNRVFVPAFMRDGMEEKTIALKPWDKKAEYAAKNKINNPLRFWLLPGRNRNDHLEALKDYIVDMRDVQGVDLKDVAVLAHGNSYLDSLAEMLESADIPVDRKTPLAENKVKQLLFAIIDIVKNPRNEISRAQIAYLTQQGQDAATIIDNKLVWNSLPKEERGEYLADIPLVSEVLSMQGQLSTLSLKTLIETLIVELNLHAVSETMYDSEKVDATFQALVSAADEYEERCMSMGLPATLTGFSTFLDNAEINLQGDENAIHLTTYHSSKGLQWKYVILTDLNYDPEAPWGGGTWDKCNYSGVHVEHLEMPTEQNLYPPMIIRLQPWIFGTSKGMPDEVRATCDEDHIAKLKADNIRECKRLMYVGMTRAADVMIFAAHRNAKGELQKKWFDAIGADFNSIGAADYMLNGNLTEQERKSLAFQKVSEIMSAESEEDENNGMFDMPSLSKVNVLNIKSAPCTNAIRDLSPSKLKAMGKIERVKYWDKRLHFSSALEDNEIGNCIHQIFAGIENYAGDEELLAHIINVLTQWNCDITLTAPADILYTWNKFKEHMTATYGTPYRTYHELGFKYKEDGQIFTGNMDFVWEVGDNKVVLVDYKTCQLGIEHIEDELNLKGHYAGMYKGQFDCYSKALEKSGKTIIDKLIFYPSSGLLVRFVE